MSFFRDISAALADGQCVERVLCCCRLCLPQSIRSYASPPRALVMAKSRYFNTCCKPQWRSSFALCTLHFECVPLFLLADVQSLPFHVCFLFCRAHIVDLPVLRSHVDWVSMQVL
jgi:hypothetical protein